MQEDKIVALEKLRNEPSYAFQDSTLQDLIEYMLDNVGNSNPYLRDTLIYNGFCRLILDEMLNEEQIKYILDICINDEHLYLNIHETNLDDSVFTRSFSALVLTLILYKDKENRELPRELVVQTIEKSIDYLNLEYDYRGYVEEKGWAHSVAHGSDLLAQAISHPFFSEVSSIDKCLSIIQKCLHTDYAYIDEEDERLLAVIEALLMKGLTDQQFKDWLITLQIIDEKDELKNYRIKWNVKKFTLTLYTHLIRTNQCKETEQWIFSSFIMRWEGSF